MTLETIELQTREAPRFSLLVLHGLGADGNDFVPVVQALDLSPVLAQGGLRVVLPSAPEIPVTINGGMRMRAWYDIRHGDLSQREDADGLRASQALIEELIAREEREFGIPPERVVLMGFSQGCAMTLMTGLRYPRRLAGLVGLSGYLPLLDTTEAQRSPANAATPIFLAHGTGDGVVLPARAKASLAELRRLGHAVDWHEFPMAHEVSMDEIQALQAWLVKTLTAAA
ncbi:MULTISPECIES: alpha/beta hydrolase [unclassified Roseateles]|mgnify:CR=1 FL=1|jgi:phospholipase/carboxylesterase|nr:MULTISPECIES: alpha/beta hydrolase [unclassified Roseateles]MBB3284304.1 phospholipase/carboxylesterase [Mitsuaria sp. BK037]MBB3291434.1 phospholipase/carboxylesterase [Mitsuaria sp. BK041]MBB3360651.1 phospholipase/carboxylesterase [Mitsuaria sp. BK045]